jgi:hypothetical protein
MPIATIAVDLAKTVFELAAADDSGKIVERRRLGRAQFERYFENRECAHVIMEASGSAHYWGDVSRRKACECHCCRLITFVPMSVVTRPIAPTPRHCLRRLGLAISFPSR